MLGGGDAPGRGPDHGVGAGSDERLKLQAVAPKTSTNKDTATVMRGWRATTPSRERCMVLLQSISGPRKNY